MAVSIFFFSLRRESPHFMSFFAKWIEKWLLALTIYHGQIDCSLHKNVNSLVIAEVFCGVRNHGETGKYIYIYIIKYIFITGYTLVILPVALVNFKENYFYTKKNEICISS